ncbi:hypothetical protein MMC17_002851 [Xylographa soralifera]|nr:hypothetical protein [Xylographa soralifera]
MTDHAKRDAGNFESQEEKEKSAVVRANDPVKARQEYDKGDTVKFCVLENGVLKPKKMEIVDAEFRGNKYVYQIKFSGATESIYKDKNGNDWFKQDDLEWWC